MVDSEAPCAGYDVIGDVHGHAHPLRMLLAKMGYLANSSGTYVHASRQAVFVGDLINRGPHVRETLRIARDMAEAKSAHVVLGNHEFNVLGMEINGADGYPLRSHSRENLAQRANTHAAFRDYPEEWTNCLAWMRMLPLSLELQGCRVVHAAWHPPSLEVIGGRTFEDEGFLRVAFDKKTPEAKAVGISLKGIKVGLPRNGIHKDRFGHPRTKGRIRWWANPTGKDYAELLFPPYTNAPRSTQPASHSLKGVIPYPEEACPVFFGHYCLPPTEPKIHGNAVCVDGCVTCDNKLWAYRFDGEKTPSSEKLVWAN